MMSPSKFSYHVQLHNDVIFLAFGNQILHQILLTESCHNLSHLPVGPFHSAIKVGTHSAMNCCPPPPRFILSAG